jgi:hypothetical protein
MRPSWTAGRTAVGLGAASALRGRVERANGSVGECEWEIGVGPAREQRSREQQRSNRKDDNHERAEIERRPLVVAGILIEDAKARPQRQEYGEENKAPAPTVALTNTHVGL